VNAEIKESLISLLTGIKNSDGPAVDRHMRRLDEILAANRGSLHPQLAHFLERRSYAKALTFLGGETLGRSPFDALSSAGLPSAPPPKVSCAPPIKNRGRVDVIRETGNRGGKTVTVVTGFTGIGLPEKETLAKKMRAACGCGGTVKNGAIEIQGDQRETVARILAEAGFRPVFAGG
jgi:translation initiation factor 1